MSMERKRVFRWWWSWNAEKTAAWLEKMAADGWMLERTNFNMTVFYFLRDHPRRMSFCADFQSSGITEYKTFILDAGWTLVMEAGGWFLWAREYAWDEEKPAFFSDTDSLVARNNRVLLLMGVILISQFAAFQVIVRRLMESPSPFMVGLSIVYFLIFGLLGYAVVRTLQENRRLKKQL